MKAPAPGLIDEKRAATMLGRSVRTLQAWRRHEIGPPYVRLASRSIAYREEDVLAFIEARVVGATNRRAEVAR